MLLNLDLPTKKARLHHEGCHSIPKPYGTAWKPVGDLGRDGGWFEVDSVEEARELVRRYLPSADFQTCPKCDRPA
ncbi:hypothetical protein GCM10028813_29900 [Ramlibacter alkalitolerans]